MDASEWRRADDDQQGRYKVKTLKVPKKKVGAVQASATSISEERKTDSGTISRLASEDGSVSNASFRSLDSRIRASVAKIDQITEEAERKSRSRSPQSTRRQRSMSRSSSRSSHRGVSRTRSPQSVATSHRRVSRPQSAASSILPDPRSLKSPCVQPSIEHFKEQRKYSDDKICKAKLVNLTMKVYPRLTASEMKSIHTKTTTCQLFYNHDIAQRREKKDRFVLFRMYDVLFSCNSTGRLKDIGLMELFVGTHNMDGETKEVAKLFKTCIKELCVKLHEDIVVDKKTEIVHVGFVENLFVKEVEKVTRLTVADYQTFSKKEKEQFMSLRKYMNGMFFRGFDPTCEVTRSKPLAAWLSLEVVSLAVNKVADVIRRVVQEAETNMRRESTDGVRYNLFREIKEELKSHMTTVTMGLRSVICQLWDTSEIFSYVLFGFSGPTDTNLNMEMEKAWPGSTFELLTLAIACVTKELKKGTLQGPELLEKVFSKVPVCLPLYIAFNMEPAAVVIPKTREPRVFSDELELEFNNMFKEDEEDA